MAHNSRLTFFFQFTNCLYNIFRNICRLLLQFGVKAICNSISLNQKERCESLFASCQSRRAARRAKKKLPHVSHHAAASGRSRPSYAITRGRREAHVGDQRVVLVCGPNRPHQIRRPSPRSRSPPLPPSRSAIADLLEASPSTQSLGPPPPVGREEGSMALLQRRIRRQRGTPPQRAPKVRLTRETYASSLPGDLIISA